jgi:hypothetical protein
MKKIIIWAILLLLVAIPAMALHAPDIAQWSINPCRPFNSTTPMRLSFNATSCEVDQLYHWCLTVMEPYVLPDWAKGDVCAGATTIAAQNTFWCDRIAYKVEVYANASGVDNASQICYPATCGTWSAYQNSWIPTIHIFNLNSSLVGSYTIKIFVKSEIAIGLGTEIIPFETSANGHNYGECSETETPANNLASRQQDSIPVLFNSGGSWTSTILWISLMLVVGGLIFFGIIQSKTRNASPIGLGILAFIEFILLFIGVYYGFISWIWLLLLAILVVAGAWIKVKQWFA